MSLLVVTRVPSRPDMGEVLTAKRMEIVGSSTTIRLSGLGLSLVQIVSPMWTSSIPARTTMSPDSAPVVSTSLGPT